MNARRIEEVFGPPRVAVSDYASSSLLPALLAVLLLLAGGFFFWSYAAAPAPRPHLSSAPQSSTVETQTAFVQVDAARPGRGEIDPDRTEVAAEPRSGDDSVLATLDRTEDEAASAHARGRVVDETGAPIAGAMVSLSDMPQIEDLPIRMHGVEALAARSGEGRLTDADGGFVLPLARSGVLTLQAWHDDYRPATLAFEVERGGTAEGLVLEMSSGASIQGRIVGMPADGATPRVAVLDIGAARPSLGDTLGEAAGSFAGIDVSDLLGVLLDSIGERSTDVDPETGGFEVRGLDPARKYRVWGFVPGPGFQEGSVTTRRVETVAGTRGLELPWQSNPVLLVRVVDASTGNALTELDVAAGLHRAVKIMGMSLDTTPVTPLQQKHFEGGLVRIDRLTPRPEGDEATVEVGALGYRTSRIENVRLPDTGQVDLGTLQLERAPTVRVHVVSAVDGLPVAGAHVQLDEPEDDDAEEDDGDGGSVSFRVSTSADTSSGMPDFSEEPEDVVTDSDGYAELTCPEAATVLVRIEHDEHAPFAQEVGPLPELGRVDVDCTLHVGGRVDVLVLDRDGSPVPGFRVARRTQKGVDDDESELDRNTDVEGRAVFEHLNPGVHGFRVTERPEDEGSQALQMVMETTGMGSIDWHEVQVVDGGRLEIRLDKPRYAELDGGLTLDGEPLEGAKVQLLPRLKPGADAEDEAEAEIAMGIAGDMMSAFGVDDGTSTTTDELGEFALRKAPLGRHRVVFQHADLAAPVTREIDLIEGPNTLVVALRDTRVSGRVTDPAGHPIRGATVRLLVDRPGAAQVEQVTSQFVEVFSAFGVSGGTGSAKAQTDADGRFVIRGVPSGTPYRVHVTKRLHQSAGIPLGVLAEGANRDDVAVVLQPGGRIRVSVADAETLASVDAEWLGDDPEGPADVSGLLKAGRCYLDGLRPGTWRVTLQGFESGEAPTRDVEVVAGETARAEF